MFNKLLLALTFTLSIAYAVDDFSSERLLGIEVGYTTVNSANEIGLVESKSDAEFGIRLGAQNEEWRTTLRANFLKTQGRNYQKVMLDFDRFVWASLYKTDSVVFKPYLGAHVGWLHYTDEVIPSENGLAYGGQMGLALNVLNQVDFDIAYRYTAANVNDVDDMSSFVFGVNYIY
jgi:opacity protein-like surface antigen